MAFDELTGLRRKPTPLDRQIRNEEITNNRNANARFAVAAFWVRPDNQGNNRIFRKIDFFGCPKRARRFYNKKRSPSHVYVVLFSTSTMDVISERGDPSVEDKWVEAPTAPDYLHPNKMF
jgi:hypothetical protein